ncbi:metalloendopeptidase KNAG_0B06080 [Huiozyma naganishii CBS 8797]|uniref:Peptidase M16 N-terminal domain-containing protein n=1 Tax=Huiozyma naganishii (strain ATCC MYA-139 / BCRC 22969 / CBS 8797 / KCTC 17520 / NBRC 10181 / NCYC 3082 / Yp74L-3) TaxID=1071383 RepID=J7RHM0_HUIN7|nr:hypothetical protein KNAG_0B06080 [Kazachstania naganishii CBS 8797]CCK69038.1 hypothetical protein KNAG_0B06080 [Kazachstania naganishii CBS 8797]
MSIALFSACKQRILQSTVTRPSSQFTKMSAKILQDTFLQPDLDDRSYRYVQLPNNLKALLISDPTTDKAAAALDVNIGAFEDPEELPGLAHFCEHLLFMGSSKFPNENEYSSYLSKHGGSSNAYTGAQNTNYYFQVNYEHLYGALDRFSGFFTGPLFNKESTDKEINAVDSENKKNLQNDLWRLYQLDKSLTNGGHPYHKFSTGNLETLGTTPKELGLDIRDELLKFYNKSYSANLMKLCILGREDLDTMTKWVEELFQDVKTLDRALPEYNTRILDADHLQEIIKVHPVKELKKVEVSFVVPDVDEHWESKPPHILSHLIGHEGTGSLLAYLKTKGWANELSAGGHTVSKGNAFFSVDIDLTDDGLAHYEEVVHNVFQYIKMLQNCLPQNWVFHELQEIAQANFKFEQKGSPSNTVSTLAKALEKEYIPVNRILSNGLLTKYEPELVAQYCRDLKPENSRITLIGKDLKTSKREKWYGTEYEVEKYSPDLLAKISTPLLNSHLHLPHPNEFIANNFKVDKPEGSSADEIVPLEEPLLISENETGKVWFKKDDRFWQPRGYIYLTFKLPHTHASALNSMLSTLYVQLINDSLKDLQYNANCANLRASFVKTNQGLDLTLYGFNDKLIILLTRLLEGIKSFKLEQPQFKIFKDKSVQHLKNLMYEVPYSQISTVYNYLINERSWSVEEKLDVMEKITYEELINFIPTIFEELYFEALIHGNLKYEEAMEIASLVKILQPSDVTRLQTKNSRMRSYLIPRGETYRYETKLKDAKNVNSCIQYVTQLDVYDEKLSAKSGLFAQMIHEPCFDTLRTKEQLGYVVFSSSLNNHGTANMRILIQSEHTTPYLEFRIDTFYQKFGELLNAMSEEDFSKHKNALCKSLLQKYKNMQEESTRYTAAVYLGDYNFTHHQKKAALVEKLTKEEMLEFYKSFIVGDKATKLVIHLQSQVTDNKSLDESKLDTEVYPTGQLITDVGEFKSKLYVAPVRQPLKEFAVYEP